MKKNQYVIIALVFTCIIALLINGCAPSRLSFQKIISTYQTQSWQERYQALSHVLRWSIGGVFSIHQPGKTIIAFYDWQQKVDSYNIHVYSLPDIYSINISGYSGIVLLWLSPKECYTADTPERLMQVQLGWQLPVSNLYYWIRGIPAPGAYHANFDPHGHCIILQQNGWYIRFSQYTHVGPIDFPRILKLSSREMAIKIIIKHFEVYDFLSKSKTNLI